MEGLPKILVIEDDESIATYLARVFDHQLKSSCSAEVQLPDVSAREEIHELISQRPCAMVLDYSCDTKGDFVRSASDSLVPVLVTSGYDAQKVSDGMNEGGLCQDRDYCFLHKPFSITEVRKFLKTVCLCCRHRVDCLKKGESGEGEG